MEYPIFFSHFVGVKKKMRKAADKFLRESGVCDQYLPDTACANFAKEK